MKGIIVLEGADGTGKTTLARALVDRYDAFYIHNGLWPNMWQRHLAAVDLAIKKSQHQLVVIDRLYLSEQIYGQVFRAGPAYDLGARCLDRVLQRHGALTVLCVRKDIKRHLEHFNKLKGVRPEKFDNMSLVSVRYFNLAYGYLRAEPNKLYVNQLTKNSSCKQRLDFETYDMDQDGDNLVRVCESLIARLQNCREGMLPGQARADHPNFAGHPATAQYLFVGEQLSGRACPRAAPFMWSDEMCAATWLNNTLRELNFDESTAIWTNAAAKDDWLPMLLDLPATVRVIALGAVAQERVAQLGFPNVRCIPHPQYARRFQTNEPQIYRNALRDALHV